MQWSSQAMYEGKIVANEHVKHRVIDEFLSYDIIDSMVSEFIS